MNKDIIPNEHLTANEVRQYRLISFNNKFTNSKSARQKEEMLNCYNYYYGMLKPWFM